MIKVSVIVPVYNVEEYLEKCLESLVNQTLKDIEIIVVNDGSPDNSQKIIDRYKEKYHNIISIEDINHGQGYARNKGISLAKGKYIMFLDSDDTVELTILEKMYNIIEKQKVDVVISDINKIINNQKIYFKNYLEYNSKDNINLMLSHPGPVAKLYKKELFIKNNIKFVENLKYEDAPFVIEALDCAKKIGKVNLPLNYYVIHEKSETTVRDEKVFDIIQIIDIIRKYTKNKKYLKEKIDKLTVRIITNYTIQQRMQEDKNVGIRFINEAFSYLKKEVPDYKNNKYFENRSFFKRTIEKNMLLTKIYIKLYK